MKDFSTIYTVRTDLASEAREYWREKNNREPDGTHYENREIFGISVDFLEVMDSEGENITGKPKGHYSTVNVGEIWNSDSQTFTSAMNAVACVIKDFIPENAQSCLVAGLGNSAIVADAVGPFTCSNIIVTHHIKQTDPLLFEQLRLCDTMCVCPGVLGSTGLEGADIVSSVVKNANPDFVIAIDALASRKLSRLATTIQVCDTGISPGSGINNTRKALCKDNLGVPVIAIGIPTVVEASTLAYDILCSLEEKSLDGELAEKPQLDEIKQALSQGTGSFFVTPKETDHIIRDTSKLLGYAINLALHENLSREEIDEFLS